MAVVPFRRISGRGRPMPFRSEVVVEFLRHGIHRAIESPDPLSVRRRERPIPLRPAIHRRVKLEPWEIGGVASLRVTPRHWQGGKTMLYFHGGGYCCCSSETHRALASRLALAAEARVLVLDYRLAPEHPFPAALDDAISAFQDLLTAGVDPRNITFAGDSAGGGLCVATLVRLRQEKRELPAGAAIFSPWVDLSLSTASLDRNAATDYLSRGVLTYFARSYLGETSSREPLASPLRADLSGLPPLLVHTGQLEVLADEGKALASRAEAAGVVTRFRQWEGCFHDFHACAPVIPDAITAIRSAGKFLGGL